MRAVKQMIERGLAVPMAIRGALLQRGLEVQTFAERYGLERVQVSQVINLRLVPTLPILQALVGELGGTVEEWRSFWFDAARTLPPAVKDTRAGGRRRVG